MTYKEWRKAKDEIIKDASPATLEALFYNAYMHGFEYAIEREDRYAFNEEGNKISFTVESIASLDRHFVLASGGSRPGRDDNQPGRRPLGGATFGPK